MTAAVPADTPRARDAYAEAAVHRILAEDPAIAEQGIEIRSTDGVIELRGEVESEARRTAIGQTVAGHFPDKAVRNAVTVCGVECPEEWEKLS